MSALDMPMSRRKFFALFTAAPFTNEAMKKAAEEASRKKRLRDAMYQMEYMHRYEESDGWARKTEGPDSTNSDRRFKEGQI